MMHLYSNVLNKGGQIDTLMIKGMEQLLSATELAPKMIVEKASHIKS